MAVAFKNKKIGNYPVLEIEGRIIDSDSEKFAKKVETLCMSSTAEKAIIDLSSVEFIDSFGLGLLVRYHSLLLKDNRELVFLYSNQNPHSFLWRLFDVTGLRTVFRIIDSPEQI
jgi:anti-anti-sigma factor